MEGVYIFFIPIKNKSTILKLEYLLKSVYSFVTRSAVWQSLNLKNMLYDIAAEIVCVNFNLLKNVKLINNLNNESFERNNSLQQSYIVITKLYYIICIFTEIIILL